MSTRTKRTVARGILLGRHTRKKSATMGFAHTTVDPPADCSSGPECEDQAMYYEGDSHLMTFAPTGAGKGRNVIIPTLLTYPGSVVIIDPKGENCAVTARRREEMGQKVVVLDPMNRATRNRRIPDRFNPFDLFSLPDTILDADASMLAWQLAAGHSFSRDPFWDSTGAALLSGLIAHVATAHTGDERNLNRVLELLYSDDVPYQLALLLDSGTVTSQLARREIAAFLQLPERDTRPSVLATVLSWVKSLNMDCVQSSLRSSTFDLQDLLAGRPITIYLCIPPDKLVSHRSLLRMWVAALLATVMRRTSRPEKPTLFILDECAQLGPMPLLEQAVTLLRGFGLQVWSFWQDLEQVKSNYPTGAMTMIGNSGVLQAFGVGNSLSARNLSEVFDTSPRNLLSLGADEAMVYTRNSGAVCCQRPDYLEDAEFSGAWDQNPFFDRSASGPQ